MATYSEEVLADTPLLYNKLDGLDSTTIKVDSSGNSRPADTIVGTPTYGQVALNSGWSCSFSTSGLRWNDAAWQDSSSITLEAWVNCTNIGGSQTPIIWERDTSGGRSFQFRIDTTGKLQLIFWTDAGGPTSCYSTATLANGTTYHVAATYDSATGVAKAYLNGVQDGTVTVAASPLKSVVSPLRMGCGAGGTTGDVSTAYYSGRIDEAAYYGTALSAARISAHYSATAVPPAPIANLYSQSTEVVSAATDGRLYSQSADVVSAQVPSNLHSQSADVIATVDHRSRITSLWADVPLGADHRSRIQSMHVEVVGTGLAFGAAEPTNDLWIWNGTTKVPANVRIWNGTTLTEAGVSVV